MNKRYKIAILTGLLASGYLISQLTTSRADGVNNKAGSADDPLVTKSYVDQILQGKIPTASNSGTATTTPSLDEISKYITSELDKRLQDKPQQTEPSATHGSSQGITVVNLTKDQTLFAGEGAEFIVRTGKVTIVSTDGNGVPDVTSGKDLQPGAPVELNHLLVFPREGRGIKPDSKSTGDTYVMIRGNYLLVDGDKK